MGEHGWFDKRWIYEESLHMPFIMHWPGVVKAGTRFAPFIKNIDYASTFTETRHSVAGERVRKSMRSSRLTAKFIMIAVVLGLAPGIASHAASKPLKVFILAGQSNMVGHGKVEEGRDPAGGKKEVEGGLGSLRYFVRQHEDQYEARGKTPLVDGAG